MTCLPDKYRKTTLKLIVTKKENRKKKEGLISIST